MIQVAYVIFWWLVLLVIGLLSFPLVSRVCGRLPDRGYSISKLVGLVILTFLVWMISSLHIMPFGYISIWISLLLLAAFSLYLGRKSLRVASWPRRQIIISESIFTVAFVAFLLITMGKPDIYFSGAQDAFSNCAFIESILRGGYFPPLDPWFAGESIPYYYGGHVMVAVLIKLTGVPPTIAFNIAVAMFHALAVCASYGLGYSITRRKLYGFVTALFVCVVGYTSGAFQLAAYVFDQQFLGFSTTGAANIIDWLLGFDFWSAPWLVEYAVVHYPYFSFIMGDLHSYMMSVPFQVMFIMLIFAVFQRGRLSDRIERSDTLIDILILGLCLGFFFILNTWEYPTYIIFTVLAFILLRIRRTIKGNLLVPAAIIVLSFILYVPHYISGSVSGFTGLGLVTTRTTLAQFLEFSALFLFAVCSLLVILVLSKREIFRGRMVISAAILVFAATIIAAVLLDFWLLIIVIPVGLFSLYYIYRSKAKSEREFVLVLLVMGVALAFFCEFLYINDALINDGLGGEWERFNTTSRVYLQLWVFFSIAAAYAVFYVMNSLRGKTRVIWVAVLAVLILASLIHPIASTTGMLSGRHGFWGVNRGTLDGMAYIEMVDEGDYEAIQWVNENIDGSPVVLEAPQVSGKLSPRVSTFTGLPTVLGGWVESMWRHASGFNIEAREEDADTIYTTVDNSEALELLKKYDVEYIYIGTVEIEKYDGDGLQKFAVHTENYGLIYDYEGVTIYKVRE